MKIATSLKESGSLTKGVSETVEMKQRNKNSDFLA